MTILVGSNIPGLLGAIERAGGGIQRLTVVQDIDSITAMLGDEHKRIDALMLSDDITPPANTDCATALWHVVSFVARKHDPAIPTVLTLSEATPVAIQDALRAEVRRTGGELFATPHNLRSADQPAAQQLVAQIISHLNLESQRRQRVLVGVSGAGGVGTTTTIVNVSLQLVRLGLRVLIIDYDSSQAAAEMLHCIQPESDSGNASFSEQALQGQIVHHDSGLDILPNIKSLYEQQITAPQSPAEHIATLETFGYDLIALDGLRDWQSQAGGAGLLYHEQVAPLVVCPPGVKERKAAIAALQKLGNTPREGGRTALDATLLMFVEGERGQQAAIRRIRQDVLEQYPMATDLGTLPRDPALLSTIAERPEFVTVFDVAPRRSYCHAVRHAARAWAQATDIPPTWLTQRDPYERSVRKHFWQPRSRAITPARWVQASSSPAGQQPTTAFVPQSDTLEFVPDTSGLHIVDMPLSNDVQRTVETTALVPSSSVMSDAVAPSPSATTSWLDEVKQHNRVRAHLRAVAPEQQE